MKTISMLTGMLLAALGILLMCIAIVGMITFIITLFTWLPIWSTIILGALVAAYVIYLMLKREVK